MTTATQAKWVLDAAHSELTFKVKHMMIANVKGEFKSFDIAVEGGDITSAGIEVNIDASSIYTKNEQRDEHLKSADFFDTAAFPSIHFKSTGFEKSSDNAYVLKGILNIKGTSKEVSLDVEFGGTNKDPWGNEKAGFSIEGKINRKDFGLNWNAALETGGVLVSEEVKIAGEIQFLKQA